MPLPEEKRYTYADILEWNDEKRYELYSGELVALSSPANIHQEIVADLVRQFGNYLIGKKYKVYPAPFDVRLFERDGDKPWDIDTMVQPDISVVCDPRKTEGHGCKGAPDLVVEVLSPSTQRCDRRTKFNLYQKAGVSEYWVVDPESQVVLVHTLEEEQYCIPIAYTAKAVVPVTVLDDCKIDLNTVFVP